MSTASGQTSKVSHQALGGAMFHTNALFTPLTGYERIMAGIAHVEHMLATTRTSRFYYDGRERTRREWMTWLEFARKQVAA
jgi:hypothetical protein